MTTTPADPTDLRDQVREHYARIALDVQGGCCASSSDCCTSDATTAGDAPAGTAAPDAVFGAALYGGLTEGLPVAAVQASLGCGNPLLAAELRPGERVLDLGSGGGIDVLLAARLVGPEGYVHGVDMTPQMLELARRNATEAQVGNVEFHEGILEDLPLPDGCVDVVISNCVINLAADRGAVLREAHRVLVPGGRLRVSDVVAEDHLSPADRQARGSHVGCIAGAMSRSEYLELLAAAGFVDTSVEPTHEVADAMHSAVVRATRPA